MLFINDTTSGGGTEQEVDYKVSGGPPPPGDPGVAQMPPFDDTWYRIYPRQQQGPYPPPPGQRPEWTVSFQVNGELVGPTTVQNPSATIILSGGAPGAYSINVV